MKKGQGAIGADLLRVGFSILLVSIFSYFVLSLFGITLSDLLGNAVDWFGTIISTIWTKILGVFS